MNLIALTRTITAIAAAEVENFVKDNFKDKASTNRNKQKYSFGSCPHKSMVRGDTNHGEVNTPMPLLRAGGIGRLWGLYLYLPSFILPKIFSKINLYLQQNLADEPIILPNQKYRNSLIDE